MNTPQKTFRKPIFVFKKKTHKTEKQMDSLSPGLRLGTLTQSHRWNLRTLLPDPGTPWIESCNLPHQAARPVHSNLAAGFFSMWIVVQRVKNTFFFSERASGLRFLFWNKNMAIWWCTWWHWWNDESNYVDNNAVIWFMAQNASKWLTNTEYDLCLWSLWWWPNLEPCPSPDGKLTTYRGGVPRNPQICKENSACVAKKNTETY